MLATAFTWMMGLMGYIRSSVRLFWHVNEIMRDNSPWAYTHTVGFAANMISFNVLFFWVSIMFVFWLGQLDGEESPGGSKSAVPGGAPRLPLATNIALLIIWLVSRETRYGSHRCLRRRIKSWVI